jgi:hypothetical protein
MRVRVRVRVRMRVRVGLGLGLVEAHLARRRVACGQVHAARPGLLCKHLDPIAHLVSETVRSVGRVGGGRGWLGLVRVRVGQDEGESRWVAHLDAPQHDVAVEHAWHTLDDGA